MSVLLSCLLSVASSHPVVLRTRLGRGLCRSATLRAVSCCAQQQHTSLAEQRCTPVLTRTSRSRRTVRTGYAYRPPTYQLLRHQLLRVPWHHRCTPEPPAVLALREETAQVFPSGAHMMSGVQQGRLLQMLVRLSRRTHHRPHASRRTPHASHFTPHTPHASQVRLSRAQRVLELGCFTGYATLWMALGLPEGGKVVTCERDERAAEGARRNFASAGAAVE